MSKIKDGAFAINLDECKSIGIHWKALYVNGINVTYFDSFGIEHIRKAIKKFIDNKNMVKNIYKIPANDSLMSEYFCVRFIDFMLEGKNLLDNSNLFSPKNMKEMIK